MTITIQNKAILFLFSFLILFPSCESTVNDIKINKQEELLDIFNEQKKFGKNIFQILKNDQKDSLEKYIIDEEFPFESSQAPGNINSLSKEDILKILLEGKPRLAIDPYIMNVEYRSEDFEWENMELTKITCSSLTSILKTIDERNNRSSYFPRKPYVDFTRKYFLIRLIYHDKKTENDYRTSLIVQEYKGNFLITNHTLPYPYELIQENVSYIKTSDLY
jgi:hypothetical protein